MKPVKLVLPFVFALQILFLNFCFLESKPKLISSLLNLVTNLCLGTSYLYYYSRLIKPMYLESSYERHRLASQSSSGFNKQI